MTIPLVFARSPSGLEMIEMREISVSVGCDDPNSKYSAGSKARCTVRSLFVRMASEEDLDLPPGIDLPVHHEPVAAAASSASAAPVLPRCWPDLDAAPTAGICRGDAWICMAWANGSCRAGASCESLHRLPNMAEEQRLVYSTDGIDRDVFGRMGAGTQATAILVRGLPTAGSQRQLRAALDGFGEWGKVVRTWVHHEPGCGYVAFKARGTAQFVMEAMQGRSLSPEGGEPLQLSWALRDPGQEQAEQVHSVGTTPCPCAPPRMPYTPARPTCDAGTPRGTAAGTQPRDALDGRGQRAARRAARDVPPARG